MPQFNYEFTVNAPIATVAAFHRDTTALRKLSPPPIFAQLHYIEPMAEGSLSKFTLWFGPIPVRWTAIHSGVSENGFTDTQARGPLEYWQHRHHFIPLNDNQTKIRESIQYKHPAGIRGLFTRLVFGKPGLWALFTYRRLATRRALSAQSGPAWVIPLLVLSGLTLIALVIGQIRSSTHD